MEKKLKDLADFLPTDSSAGSSIRAFRNNFNVTLLKTGLEKNALYQ